MGTETDPLIPTAEDHEDHEEESNYSLYALVFSPNTSPPCPMVPNASYLKLSAYEKYRMYGHFPYTMFWQFLMIVLFFCQVSTFDWGIMYQGHLRKALFAGLLQDTTLLPAKNDDISNHYHHRHDVVSDLQQVLLHYHRLPDEGIMGLSVRYAGDIHGQLTSSNGTTAMMHFIAPVLALDWNTLDKMDIQMKLQLYSKMECFEWHLQWKYTMGRHRASLDLQVHHQAKYCASFLPPPTTPRAVDGVVALLALLLCLSSIRNVLKPIRLTKAYAKWNPDFAQGTLAQKWHFMTNFPFPSGWRTFFLFSEKNLIIIFVGAPAWQVLNCAASCATLAYCILHLVPSTNELSRDEGLKLWMGTASFLNCLCIPQYFSGLGGYAIITDTIQRAAPQIIRVMICFLPVMFIYVWIGTWMFGQTSHRFESYGASWVTLFSVANGDEIRATINSMYHDGSVLGFVGAAFIISYIVVFMYVVLTIIISIMEKNYVDVAKAQPVVDSPLEESVSTFLRESYSMTQEQPHRRNAPARSTVRHSRSMGQ